jgi:hypothetical protein
MAIVLNIAIGIVDDAMAKPALISRLRAAVAQPMDLPRNRISRWS